MIIFMVLVSHFKFTLVFSSIVKKPKYQFYKPSFSTTLSAYNSDKLLLVGFIVLFLKFQTNSINTIQVFNKQVGLEFIYLL